MHHGSILLCVQSRYNKIYGCSPRRCKVGVYCM